jgi:hypothetical protein
VVDVIDDFAEKYENRKRSSKRWQCNRVVSEHLVPRWWRIFRLSLSER